MGLISRVSSRTYRKMFKRLTSIRKLNSVTAFLGNASLQYSEEQLKKHPALREATKIVLVPKTVQYGDDFIHGNLANGFVTFESPEKKSAALLLAQKTLNGPSGQIIEQLIPLGDREFKLKNMFLAPYLSEHGPMDTLRIDNIAPGVSSSDLKQYLKEVILKDAMDPENSIEMIDLEDGEIIEEILLLSNDYKYAKAINPNSFAHVTCTNPKITL